MGSHAGPCFRRRRPSRSSRGGVSHDRRSGCPRIARHSKKGYNDPEGARGVVSTSNYRLVKQGDIFFIIYAEASYCPICGKLLVTRGNRQRILIAGDGRKVKLIIRRLRCDDCKRIHHDLPDCIVPYKRHCAETVEAITGGAAAPCDFRTIARILAWWAAVRNYFLNILKSLAQKHGAKYKDPPAFKETIRAIVNSNSWIFSHSTRTRSVVLSG